MTTPMRTARAMTTKPQLRLIVHWPQHQSVALKSIWSTLEWMTMLLCELVTENGVPVQHCPLLARTWLTEVSPTDTRSVPGTNNRGQNLFVFIRAAYCLPSLMKTQPGRFTHSEQSDSTPVAQRHCCSMMKGSSPEGQAERTGLHEFDSGHHRQPAGVNA